MKLHTRLVALSICFGLRISVPEAAMAQNVEVIPDSIVWLPSLVMKGTALGPFGARSKPPDAWLVQAWVWSLAPFRDYVLALVEEPDRAPERIEARFCRDLVEPPRTAPKRTPGAAVHGPDGGSFFVMRALASRKASRDDRGRTRLYASAFVDSLTAARAPWVVVYSGLGERIHTLRLGRVP